MNETKNNFELLGILMDKWKHHDALCYQRLNTFWLIQSIIIGVIVIVFRAGIIPANLFISGGFALLAALGSYIMRGMSRADIRVRNTYNDSILQLLKPHTNLSKISEEEWELSKWKPDNYKNPINYWHTPNPLELGKKGLGSLWADRSYTGIMCIGSAVCSGFWVWAIVLLILN